MIGAIPPVSAASRDDRAHPWEQELAAVLLKDREDRKETPAGAARKAARYAAFLDYLDRHRHDVSTCEEEVLLREWPGNVLFHLGQATVLMGAQGKGKTNTLSFLIGKVLAHRPDWDVYTNVPFPWDPGEDLEGRIPTPPNLHHVRDMRGLLRGIATSMRARRPSAIAIDETDQATMSHDWSTDRSESWTKFLFIERHLRVRGPVLAYHVYEHVPLPLRRVGDLRGSYVRVVQRQGEHRLARVEDMTAWWVVGESPLPFLTLGLHGFDINVDMGDLETHLSGGHERIAEQILEYLDRLEAVDRREGPSDVEALLSHRAQVAAEHDSSADLKRAERRRKARILRWILDHPDVSNGEAVRANSTSHKLVRQLRALSAEERDQLLTALEDEP